MDPANPDPTTIDPRAQHQRPIALRAGHPRRRMGNHSVDPDAGFGRVVAQPTPPSVGLRTALDAAAPFHRDATALATPLLPGSPLAVAAKIRQKPRQTGR
ncbi:MAG: hypothetical protein AMS18_10185 [Gemmatimonas sp. SG8_17]|nr:MAG: hypothetical protein AMS18_10185 [Gemmatimonas sp. SG8_17]